MPREAAETGGHSVTLAVDLLGHGSAAADVGGAQRTCWIHEGRAIPPRRLLSGGHQDRNGR